jgi:hypothetical protein
MCPAVRGKPQIDGKDFTIQLFPNCNHIFIRGGAMCERSDRPGVNCWMPAIDWLNDVLE